MGKFNIKQKGQVALIVLLVSAAVMTLGLSMSQKTVVDTKIETNEEQLKQAFNTAESGIEYYLGTGSTRFTSPDNQSIADIQVSNVGLGSTINFNQYTLLNKTQQFWLVGHLSNGGIDYSTYYQGNSINVCLENSFVGSLKVDYFYLDSLSAIQVSRLGYNLTSGYVSGFSDLSPLPGTGGCQSGYRQVSLGLSLGGGIKPLLLAIKPLRSGVKMYLLGSGQNFPIQGIELSSIGRVGDVTTGVNRKINVLKLYQVPSFFLDSITTYGSVLSN
jgi:Tfp pilus assembly protein PilX